MTDLHGLSATEYRLAAARLDELARLLADEAHDLSNADPRRLGGDAPGFTQSVAVLHLAATRLRVGDRSISAVAALCRDRAARWEDQA